MATRYLSLIGWNTNAGSSGDAFFQPYSVEASNDRWQHMTLAFNDAASPAEIFDAFRVPSDFVDSPSIVAYWDSATTTGSVVYRFGYRSTASTESLDQTSQAESASTNVQAPSAAYLMQVATIGLSENFAVNELVEYEFMRNATNGSDDHADTVNVHGLWFAYADA